MRRRLTSIKPALSTEEKLLDAAVRWVDSDTEDDQQFERNRQAVITAAIALRTHGTQHNPRALARLAVVDRHIQLAARLSRRAGALRRRFTASAHRLEQLAARTAGAD